MPLPPRASTIDRQERLVKQGRPRLRIRDQANGPFFQADVLRLRGHGIPANQAGQPNRLSFHPHAVAGTSM